MLTLTFLALAAGSAVSPETVGIPEGCDGENVMMKACNTEICDPIDCTFDDWADWSLCTCEYLISFRTRAVQTPDGKGGQPCLGDVKEFKACDLDCTPEPVDAAVSDWNEWGDCSVSCGGAGERMRSRDLTPALNGGKTFHGDLLVVQPCETPECPKAEPQDCKLSEWSSWSHCSAEDAAPSHCGPGEKTRDRKIIQQPSIDGNVCGPTPLVQTEYCSVTCDPLERVDAEVTEWSDWGTCSVTSGSGQQSRFRTIVKHPRNGGMALEGPLKTVRPCHVDVVREDCKLGEWDSWTSCTVTCGGGQHTRSREVASESEGLGHGCIASLTETTGCNEQLCPVPTVPPLTQPPVPPPTPQPECKVTDWSDWGDCDAPLCGRGQKMRKRELLDPDVPLGNFICEDALEVTAACDGAGIGKEVCNRNCEVEEWAAWAVCPVSCGGGQRTRSRGFKSATGEGSGCADDVRESEPCNTMDCPEPKWDAVVSDWSGWEPCSVTCGTGQMESFRTIKKHATGGGTPFTGDLTRVKGCHSDCPEEEEYICQVTEWTEWSDCSTTCGSGTHTRKRGMLHPYSGKCLLKKVAEYQELDATLECGNKELVPEDQVVECLKCKAVNEASKKASKISKTPKIEWTWVPLHYDYLSDDPLKNTSSSYWEEPGKSGDSKCTLALDEFGTCFNGACPEPVDCDMSEWGDWGVCSVTCGGLGMRERARTVTAPKYGGRACDPKDWGSSLIEFGSCGWITDCPTTELVCSWSDWTDWEECPVTCGGAVTKKTRKMEITREVTGNAAKVQLPWTSSGWANAGTFTAVLGTLSLAALAFAGRSVAHRYSQYHRMTPGPEMQNELASEQTTRDLLEEYNL